MFFGDVHKIVLSFAQRRSMKSTIITVDNKAMHSLQEIWFKAWFLNVVLTYLIYESIREIQRKIVFMV